MNSHFNNNENKLNNLPVKKRYRETFEVEERNFSQKLKIEDVFSLNDGSFDGIRKKLRLEEIKEAEKEDNKGQFIPGNIQESKDENKSGINQQNEEKIKLNEDKKEQKPKIWRPFEEFVTETTVQDDKSLDINSIKDSNEVLNTNYIEMDYNEEKMVRIDEELKRHDEKSVNSGQKVSDNQELLRNHEELTKNCNNSYKIGENLQISSKSTGIEVMRQNYKISEKHQKLINRLNEKYLKRLVHRARQQHENVLIFRKYKCSACNLENLVKKMADHHAKNCCQSEVEVSLEVKKILFK